MMAITYNTKVILNSYGSIHFTFHDAQKAYEDVDGNTAILLRDDVVTNYSLIILFESRIKSEYTVWKNK